MKESLWIFQVQIQCDRDTGCTCGAETVDVVSLDYNESFDTISHDDLMKQSQTNQ